MQEQKTAGIPIGVVFQRTSKEGVTKARKLVAKVNQATDLTFSFVFPDDIARQLAIRIRKEQEANAGAQAASIEDTLN